MPAPALPAFFSYLGASLGWLVLLVMWPIIAGPYIDPVCIGSASFGFLPAIMVVPFLVLLLYVLTVLVHAVFAFRRRRLSAIGQTSALQAADAAFFIPFAVLSTLALGATVAWDAALHCFAIAAVLALPWVLTPILQAKLSAWSRSEPPSSN